MSNQSPTRPRRLIGYARVSTEEQVNDAQVDALRTAGCHIVHQEHGSGASRSRPVLAKLMREIRAGDVLVVVRLDRLARSVSHLLEVIEDLEGFVATADLKRKGGRSEANYAARIANCSARDGFGLKAYLACRLRIM